jgi:hypothetical protein
MRKLNNYKIIYLKKNDCISEVTASYHPIGYLLHYLNIFFLQIQHSLTIIHKYETWHTASLFFPSITLLSKYKSIFFKRTKQIVNNKLVYTLRVVIPNEDNLTHYLSIYLKNIFSLFFNTFRFAFIKFILLWSFWQVKLFNIISYMLQELLDLFLAELIAILIYFLE